MEISIRHAAKSLLPGLFIMLAATASGHNIIPAPKEIRTLKPGTVALKSVDAKVNARAKLPAEGYTIEIRGGKAVLRAKTAQGLVWAKATLAQLKDSLGRVPIVSVRDWPAFPFRGFMHDTGRNFRTIETLKRELKLFSDYKINVFHWHLTDNPAWRIECKAYPQLNDPKFQVAGRDEGKFYSYAEIRDVFAYARSLGITVIPEIDMPGHSEYFRKAFGFAMDSKQGMEVLAKCIGEFFSEIPARQCPYFHIGSDEVHVADPAGFIAFCEKEVARHGSTPIVWDPGLPPSGNTLRQIWVGTLGEKTATEGYPHRYIDSYMGYLNHGCPPLNTAKFFLHTPCGTGEATANALGGELCLWNDIRVADKSLLFPDNGMPNGLLAFAERFWVGGKWKSLAEESLLPAPGERGYEELQDFERRLVYHRDNRLYDWDMRWVANASHPWLVSLPQRRGSLVSSYKWAPAYGGFIDMLAFSKKHGVSVLPSMDAWIRTEVYSPADTVVDAWTGFESPVRNSRISDGIGPQGLWENDGRLFVNGAEVFPSQPWEEPGKYRYHYNPWGTPAMEIPYTREQLFWVRKQVARVRLRKGWNEVSLYCPRKFDNNYCWMASFLPVHIDGNGHVSEVRGLEYRLPQAKQ